MSPICERKNDLAGHTASAAIGPSGALQTTETLHFDPATGRLSSQVVQRGTELPLLLNLSYAYDPSGQLHESNDGNAQRTYTYDAVGRLQQVAGTDPQNKTWTEAYRFDPYGNRLSVTATGMPADGIPSIAYDPKTNHAVGATYDEAGNQHLAIQKKRCRILGSVRGHAPCERVGIGGEVVEIGGVERRSRVIRRYKSCGQHESGGKRGCGAASRSTRWISAGRGPARCCRSVKGVEELQDVAVRQKRTGAGTGRHAARRRPAPQGRIENLGARELTPFDADKSTGWPESTAAKESGPTEVNPPTTWSFVDYFTK